MSNILTIGYATEGPTDERFLKTIIKKVFEEVAFGCESIIEVYDPVCINFPKTGSFINDVTGISKRAFEIGINVLCIHVDADSNDDKNVIQFKINPAFSAVALQGEKSSCKNVIAIIPIHMIEAWMLADKDLFKEEIDTDLSNVDLGINRNAESFADPKTVIENALNVAQQNLPKRRNRLEIRDLYQPLGQKLTITHLENLPSFLKFKNSAEEALRALNYLH